MDKHSSLLQKFLNYGQKSFITLGQQVTETLSATGEPGPIDVPTVTTVKNSAEDEQVKESHDIPVPGTDTRCIFYLF